MSLTINQAIDRLIELRRIARLGGGTCLVICLPDEGYLPIEAITVENDQDGATALVCGPANIFPHDLDRLSEREHHTVLAALRYWHRTRANCVLDEPDYAGTSPAAGEDAIATKEGALEPLNGDEIDGLWERLNRTTTLSESSACPPILARLTGIASWREVPGPQTGCGLDYWYTSPDGRSAYINIDQNQATVSIDGERVYRGSSSDLGHP